jgi:hypothetical protein
MAARQPSALEAKAQAMLAPVSAAASRAAAKEALSRPCPRFVRPASDDLPFKGPLYWARRAVGNVPHVEIVADGRVVGFEVGASVSAAR